MPSTLNTGDSSTGMALQPSQPPAPHPTSRLRQKTQISAAANTLATLIDGVHSLCTDLSRAESPLASQADDLLQCAHGAAEAVCQVEREIGTEVAEELVASLPVADALKRRYVELMAGLCSDIHVAAATGGFTVDRVGGMQTFGTFEAVVEHLSAESKLRGGA